MQGKSSTHNFSSGLLFMSRLLNIYNRGPLWIVDNFCRTTFDLQLGKNDKKRGKLNHAVLCLLLVMAGNSIMKPCNIRFQ